MKYQEWQKKATRFVAMTGGTAHHWLQGKFTAGRFANNHFIY
jgi:hypothetical protein